MSNDTNETNDQQKRRSVMTYSKHVMLTRIGREKIETWARANELNFSAAIETLALLGLDDEQSGYIIPALRATTLQGIRLAFNRLARLLSDIVIEAAASRTMSEGIMLQIIREQAVAHPENFEQVLPVSRDGNSQPDARIRRFHEAVKQTVEQEAISRLKRTMSRVDQLFDEESEGVDE